MWTDNIVRVNGCNYNILYSFEVLWAGWECDSEAWVVDDSGSSRIVMTNHGSPFFATATHIKEHLDHYAKVISETNKALSMIQSED